MFRFFDSNLNPFGDELRERQASAAHLFRKPCDQVESEIDCVELDMRQRVEKGSAAGQRPKSSARNLIRRRKRRPIGPAGSVASTAQSFE